MTAPSQNDKEFMDTLAGCWALAQAGDLSKAIEACTALVKKAPTFGQGQHALGTLLWRARKYAPALQAMQSAIDCPNATVDFFFDLRFALISTRQYQAALGVSRRAAAAWGTNPDVRVMLAQSLAQCFQADEMRVIFTDLIKNEPDNLLYWEHFARSAEMVGATADVLMACEYILQTDPSKLLTFGTLYFRTLKVVGRATESARYRDALISQYMARTETKFKAIAFIENYNSPAAAENHWRQQALESPDSAFVFYSLAHNLACQGKWGDAQQVLTAAKTLSADEELKTKLQSLAVSIEHYLPILKESAAQPLQTRDPSTSRMIVVRGALEKKFIDVIKHYRGVHGDHFILLSTWETSSPELMAEVRPYVDDIALNAVPSIPGMGNLNYQIQCAVGGIRRAKELGAEYILLTRTDVAFLKPNIMTEFAALLANDKPNSVRTPGLRHRLIVCEYWSFLEPLYHLSDLFCYGHIEDVAQYWAQDHMSDACLTPEITLCRGFALKVGRQLKNDTPDVIEAVRDLFLMIEASSVQLFWPKYPAASSSPHYHHRTIIKPDMLTLPS